MKKDTLSSGQNIIINFFGISFHLIEILPTDHILLGKKLRTDFFNIWRFLFFTNFQLVKQTLKNK